MAELSSTKIYGDLKVTGLLESLDTLTIPKLLLNTAGSASLPSLSWVANPNTGLFNPATNQIGFSVNGSELIRLTTTGLGIGTTNPSTVLQIGSISNVANPAQLLFGQYSTSANGRPVFLGNWPSPSLWGIGANSNSADNTLRIGTAGAGSDWGAQGSFTLRTNNFIADGNVGIGTTNPRTKAHIWTGEVSGGQQESLRLEGNWVSNQSGPCGPLLRFTNQHDSGLNPNSGEYNLAGIQGVDDVNWGGSLVFLTAPSGTFGGENLTERMRISYNGNVGIGTTNPITLLSVAGGVTIGASYASAYTPPTNGLLVEGAAGINGLSPSGTSKLAVGGDIYTNSKIGVGTSSPNYLIDINNSANTDTQINVSSSSNLGAGIRLASTGTGGRTWQIISTGSSSTPGAGLFGIYDGTASAYRFVINSNGNIGIPTISNTRKLYVYSNTYNDVVAEFVNDNATGTNYGIRASANGAGTNNFALYGSAINASGNNWGLYIDNGNAYINGNIGIGTTNPSNPIRIYKTSDSDLIYAESTNTNNNPVRISLRNSNTTPNVYVPHRAEFWLQGYDYSGTTLTTSGIQHENGNLSVVSHDGWLTLEVNNGDIKFLQNNIYPFCSEKTNAVANTLYLKAGNVGINTSNPSSKLDIYAGPTTDYGISSSPSLSLGVSGSQRGYIRLYGTTSSRYAVVQMTNENMHIDSSADSGSLYINHYAQRPTLINPQGGNVGIGTTAPTAKLEVVGGSQAPSDSSTLFELSTGTGIYTNEKLLFGIHDGDYSWIQPVKANTAYRNLSLNPNGGNVGIGTTAPQSKLQVVGNASIANGITGVPAWNNYTLELRSGGSDKVSLEFHRPGYSSAQIYSDDGSIAFGTQSGAEQVRITSAGKVGIGTTSPGYKLDVTGDIRIPDANKFYGASFQTNDYSTMVFNSRAWSTVQGTNGKAFSFTTHTDGGSGGYEAMRINYGESGSIILKPTGAGNVGIGTTAPSFKLDVVGGSIRNYHATDPYLLLSQGVNNAYLENYSGKLHIQARSLPIYFETDSSYTVPKMMIGIDGNVGVGTTAPTSLLHLKSTASSIMKFDRGTSATFGYEISGSGTDFGFYDYSAARYVWRANGTNLLLNESGGNVGIGTTSPVANLDVNGRTVKFSNFYPTYSWKFGGGTDLDWKTIANVTLGTGLYVGVSFEINILNANSNAGATPNIVKLKYYASLYRSGAVQDDTNSAAVSGPINDYVRVVKTATGIYEIQTRQPNNWRHMEISIRAVSINSLGTGGSIVYVDDPINGSTTGTIYTPAVTHTHYFTNGYFYGSLQCASIIPTNLTSGYIPYKSSNQLINSPIYTDGTRIGIGTTTLNYALNITNSRDIHITLKRPTTGNAGIEFVSNNHTSILYGASDSHALRYFYDSSEFLTIKKDGKIGIGTSSPSSIFHVYENISGSTWAGRGVFAGSTNAIVVGQYNNNAIVGAHNTALSAWSTLYVNNTNGSDGGNIVLAGSGNVGIGTTAPGAKLDVTASASDTVGLSVYTANTSNSAYSINFNRASTGVQNAFNWQTAGVSKWFLGQDNDATNNLGFYSWTVNKWVWKAYDATGDIGFGNSFNTLYIQNSGNVGIGTTAPNGALQVGNNLTATTLYMDNQSGYGSRTSKAWITYSASDTDQSTMSGGAGLTIHNNDTTNGNWSTLAFSSFEGAGGNNVTPAAIRARITNRTIGGWANGDLAFFTSPHAGLLERMRITSNGNVGIGTTNPNKKLEVVGSSKITANDNLALLIDNPTNTGGYHGLKITTANSEAGTLPFYIESAGVRTFTVRGDGNVGIGTTSPGAKLQIFKGSAGVGLELDDANNGKGLDWSTTDGVLRYVTHSSAGGHAFEIYNLANSFIPVHLDISGNSWLNGGNVGIGTKSPGKKLTIESGSASFALTSKAASGWSPSDIFLGRYDASGGYLSGVQTIAQIMGKANSTINAESNPAAIGFYQEDSTATGVSGSLRFYTSDGSSTSNSERMRITSNGNVGIGITNPTALLHVYSSSHEPVIIQSTTTESDINFKNSTSSWQVGTNNNGNGTGGNQFFFYSDRYIMTIQNGTGNVGIGTSNPTTKLMVSNGTVNAQINPYNNIAYFGSVNNYPVALSVNGVERMRINSDGNIGIGTTSPGVKLDVTGTIRASSQLISTVATGTAPLAVTSTTKVSNLNADLFDDYNSNQYSQWARANHMLIGGGDIIIKSVSSEDTHIKWSQRFIVIADGKGTDFNTQGYYDITCPSSGVTITGVGGSNVTVTTDGVPLSEWQALYYILVPGATSGTTNNNNFRVVYYTGNLQIPANWVLVAHHNNDTNKIIPNAGLSEDFTFTDAKSLQHILTIRNGLIVRRFTV